MQKNIFLDAEDNYFTITPGEYRCKVNIIINTIDNDSKTLAFYVTYIDGNAEKNVSVKYISTSKSRIKTTTELVGLLCEVNPSLNSNDAIITNMFNDYDFLRSSCNQLIGMWLVLVVTYKTDDTGKHKFLRLKADR